MAMKTTTFMSKLEAKWAEGKYVCVGLDPLASKVPEDLQGHAHVRGTDEDVAAALSEAMVRVIQATAHVAAAYKPNTAFYERYGSFGWKALERVVRHASQTGVPVILDAKRGDIGNTNEQYASMAFDSLGADAITIHPYLGYEANKPFLDRADKGIFVLCRTSNPGAGEFQDMLSAVSVDGKMTIEDLDGGDPVIATIANISTFFERVSSHVADPDLWNYNQNCGLVTGATYPEEIRKVRTIAPDIPLLIPGVGKQGGSLEESVFWAKQRFLINSSSGIIFAGDPKAEAEKLHSEIQEALDLIGSLDLVSQGIEALGN
jgi:orotidine-5'-phosphate decarboxylase